MIKDILLCFYLILIPLFLSFAEKKWIWVQRISPMVIMYIIGLLVGNIGIVEESQINICSNFSNITVLLAIPLMLLGCDFKNWSLSSSLKAFLVGVFSVTAVTVLGFFIFRGASANAGLTSDDLAKVSGSMMGIYTGGIPNFAPVSKAVNLPDNLFLLISGYDIVVTGTYLLVIVFFGKKIIRAIFPSSEKHEAYIGTEEQSPVKDNRPLARKIGNRATSIVLAAAIVAISYFLSQILPIENKTAVIIILITTISILCSFIPQVRKLEGTFDLGLFFVYVFCLAVATMVNIQEMNFSKYIFILYYIALAVFGSLILQIIGAKIFKIDGDLTLTASISLINSPPFVPMVAAALNNKDIVLPGIAIGLLGYAVGNYLGIGIYLLLAAF